MDTSVLIMTERYSRAIYYLIPNVWYLHASSFDGMPAWEYNSMIVGEHIELLVEEYVGDNHREPPPTSGLSRNVPPCYCSPLPHHSPCLLDCYSQCIIFAVHANSCYCSPLPQLLWWFAIQMYYICIACKSLLLLSSSTASALPSSSNHSFRSHQSIISTRIKPF